MFIGACSKKIRSSTLLLHRKHLAHRSGTHHLPKIAAEHHLWNGSKFPLLSYFSGTKSLKYKIVNPYSIVYIPVFNTFNMFYIYIYLENLYFSCFCIIVYCIHHLKESPSVKFSLTLFPFISKVLFLSCFYPLVFVIKRGGRGSYFLKEISFWNGT